MVVLGGRGAVSHERGTPVNVPSVPDRPILKSIVLPLSEHAGVESVPYSWVTGSCRVLVYQVFLYTHDLSPIQQPQSPSRSGFETEFVSDNRLVRIHFIIVMIRRSDIAPGEFEFPSPGRLYVNVFPTTGVLELSEITLTSKEEFGRGYLFSIS